MKLTSTLFTVGVVALISLSSCSQNNSNKEVVKTEIDSTHWRFYEDQFELVDRYKIEVMKNSSLLFDSIAYLYRDSIKLAIIGTHLRSYEFSDIEGGVYKMTPFDDKPTFFQMTATWCKPCMEEIPALNKVADQYHEQVNFVLMFYVEDEKKVKSISDRFTDHITIIPYGSKTSEGGKIFPHLASGFPTNYLLSRNLEVIQYNGGASVPTTYTNEQGETVVITKQDAFNKNYSELTKSVKLLLE